jgi:transposase
MPFAALDLHKKVVEAIVVDDAGTVLHRDRFPATRAALEDFAQRHLTRDTRLTLEATTNTWAVVRLLQPYVAEVVPSNPLKTRAIAEARIKTDKIDAAVLVHLLRTDYLPQVWVPDEKTQRLRHLTTERANLVSDRTRLKNRIHAVLHQRLIEAPAGDLFSKANLRWLASLDLDPDGRRTLDRHLRQLAHLEAELELLTTELARLAHSDPSTKLLLSIPGVDFPVAQTLLATLGDIHRFPTADKAAAYIGIVPSTYQSAGHCYHGSITKQGRSHARWMLVQAAQHMTANPGPLGVFFRRIAKKKNYNVAVVATARKLVVIAWHMLMKNEPYRYAIPRTTDAKLSRLRIRATGQKRKSGNPKGQPLPASYGSGKQTRGIPSLDKIYASEGLPPLQPQAPGEIKMLEAYGLTQFAEQLRKAHRIPRKQQAVKTDS